MTGQGIADGAGGRRLEAGATVAGPGAAGRAAVVGVPAEPAALSVRPRPAGYLRTDAVTAGLLALLGAFMSWLGVVSRVSIFEQALGWQMLGSVLLAAPLAWRRRWPMTVGVVQALLYGLLTYLTGYDLNTSQVLLFVSFFSIGAWSAQRERATRVRALIVVGMVVWLWSVGVLSFVQNLGASEVSPVRQFLAVMALLSVVNVAFFVGAWYFGDREWARAVARADLERAYADIRELRAELVQAAVSQERLRIARELHDVVAHHVTTMSVQAAGARRLLPGDTETAATSLRQIESAGRRAVAELRTLVLTLRSEDQEEAPPGAEQIPDLLDQARAAGMQVSFEQIGPAAQVSPVVGLVLYRVVQEGLTNAAKHAGAGASTVVRLRVRDDGVELDVSDDGHGQRPSAAGTGTGLIGMHERVTAVGGTLEVGPKPRGGFRVRARIPLGEGA